jgi:D-allose transport system substrate-binding protein
MKKIGTLLFTMVIVFVLVATGCAKQEAATTTPASSPAGTAAAKQEGKPKVAVILKTLSNPFWAEMKAGIEKEAKAKGLTVDIFAATDENDLQGQAKIFEDALTKGYAGIAVAPISPVALIPSIVQANSKGIYVVNIDEKVDMKELKNAGGYIYAFATTDNVKVGEKAGKTIVDKLGAEGGEVAILEGKAGNVSGQNRKQGAENAFKAGSNIKLVTSQPADWDRTKALDSATNIMQKYPNLKAIYAANDTMALGALQAVANAGKEGKIIVVGTDGTPEAVDSVKAGKLFATVAQDPAKVGVTSMNKLFELLEKKTPGNKDMEPEFIAVDSNLITK